MVLIFSRPQWSLMLSKRVKMSLSTATITSALTPSENFVKPTMSANSTVTSGKLSAITSVKSSAMISGRPFKRSAMAYGSTLCSNRSDTFCSASTCS